MTADEATIRGILSGKLKSEMPKEADIRKLIEEMGFPFSDNAIKEIYHSIVICAFGLDVSRRDSQIKADLKILEQHADVLLKHAEELDEYLKLAVARTGELVIRQDDLYDLDESYIILALDRVKELARIMKGKFEEESKNIRPDKGGPTTHIAINILIKHIADIYESEFPDKRFTVKHDTNKEPEYNGACFDFLIKIFDLITKYTFINFIPSAIGSAAIRVMHLTKQKT
jgi:hypothetical protein